MFMSLKLKGEIGSTDIHLGTDDICSVREEEE